MVAGALELAPAEGCGAEGWCDGCTNYSATPGLEPAPHSADVNGDGWTNVVDVTCISEAALAQAVGAPLPSCLALPPALADQNCDGRLGVRDITRVIHHALYEMTLSPSLAAWLAQEDTNGNGTHDCCEQP